MFIPNNEQLKTATASARLYFLVAMVSGLVLLSTHIFERVELQTINARFEARRWINWSQESLARLNPAVLWQYHQQHEIPRQWWAWDYTLSWLLENNHPVSQHKIVLFNHQLEDEPPLDALQDHAWMKPLFHYPLSRSTVADMLIFLAKSGATMIIMDNDFPQYSNDDAKLAKAIVDCRTGQAAGHPVPVLMARTINHHSLGNVLQLEIPTAPSGLLNEISKLVPSTDPLEEMTGSTGVTLDEDQVVRRLASAIPTMNGPVIDSIPVKTLRLLNHPVQGNLPLFIDIDFAGPPNTEIYPVRPISYLLDPERKAIIASPAIAGGDVSVRGAIVILGDSVVDVFNTPTTNFGVNQMSGAEILANSIDTLSRRSWLVRLTSWQQLGYLIAVVLAGALFHYLWKTNPRRHQGPAAVAQSTSVWITEVSTYLLVIVGSYVLAAVIFARLNIIVPVLVPAISLALASLATVQWEREHEKAAALKRDLKAAEDKLVLQSALHKSELLAQKAVADAHEAALDKERRKEFARRINHDLRAPVSVLSWTIAKLRGKKLTETERAEKIDRLSNTSDRLFALINELVSNYNVGEDKGSGSTDGEICDIARVLGDSVKMQQALAEQHSGSITQGPAPEGCFAAVNHLKLSRVIDNIIRNAFLHNKPGTKVTASLSTNSRSHSIHIADNGQGIASEHLEKIFTPGYRIDKSAEQGKADGQGLGLNIVHSFVENMKGSVNVESTVGEGTTFIITLPAAPGKNVDETKGESSNHRPDSTQLSNGESGGEEAVDKTRENTPV